MQKGSAHLAPTKLVDPSESLHKSKNRLLNPVSENAVDDPSGSKLMKTPSESLHKFQTPMKSLMTFKMLLFINGQDARTRHGDASKKNQLKD